MGRALLRLLALASGASSLVGCSWTEEVRSCRALGELVGGGVELIAAAPPPEGAQTPDWKRGRADEYERLARSLEEFEATDSGITRLAQTASGDFKEVALSLRAAAKAEERGDKRTYASSRARLDAAGERLAEWQRQAARRCYAQ